MNKKYSEEIMRGIVEQYVGGQSVALLCAEHGLPRSTVYFWIKQQGKLKSSNNADIVYQDYHNLKRKYDKLEEKLKVIKESGCSLSAPLKEKLEALEKLYGQYSVHVLCEALEVSRGTFYNHIYYNIFGTETQQPVGFPSISCLSYNKRSNWLTNHFLGYHVRKKDCQPSSYCGVRFKQVEPPGNWSVRVT